MKEKESRYACPYCGNKTFNPLTKAFLGSMRSKGHPCKECGHRCVNGTSSAVFSAIIYLVALVCVLIVYFMVAEPFWDIVFIIVIIVAAYILCRIFDAFFGRISPVIRNDAGSKHS